MKRLIPLHATTIPPYVTRHGLGLPCRSKGALDALQPAVLKMLCNVSVCLVALVWSVLLHLTSLSAENLDTYLIRNDLYDPGIENGEDPDSEVRVYWHSGSTHLDFNRLGLTTTFLTELQSRYQYDTSDWDSDRSEFSLHRIRTQFEGSAQFQEFEYRLQVAWIDHTTEETRTPVLDDGYVTWSPCDGTFVTLGQFKSGFSRQYGTHSSLLQFPDRSIASNRFDLGRQAGMETLLEIGQGKLRLVGQVLNGESDKEGQNLVPVDTRLTTILSGRLGLLGEINSFEEGDLWYSRELGVVVGATYAFLDQDQDLGSGLEKADQVRWNADVSVKYRGASIHGEGYLLDSENKSLVPGSQPYGYYIQSGYFVIPQRVELALRFSTFDCKGAANRRGH